MKKLTIAALVGGILVFAWQTLSWTVLNLHHASQEYTPKQDSIVAFLNRAFSEDGAYLLPNYPPGTTYEEMQKTMPDREGKPWMQIQYHRSMHIGMGGNIFRGLIVDILAVALLCGILMKIPNAGFATLFLATLCTGLIVFLNSPYTVHIWYPKEDISAHLADALISWALCGIWLGWYLPAKRKQASTSIS